MDVIWIFCPAHIEFELLCLKHTMTNAGQVLTGSLSNSGNLDITNNFKRIIDYQGTTYLAWEDRLVELLELDVRCLRWQR